MADWSPEAWNAFWRSYQYLVQHYWHDRFWLRTPDNVIDLDWPPDHPTHRPNVLCHFHFLAGAVNSPHYSIDVWRITYSLFASDEGWEFRSSSRIYDNRDLEPSGGQVTILHEVGHLLGLPQRRRCGSRSDLPGRTRPQHGSLLRSRPFPRAI